METVETKEYFGKPIDNFKIQIPIDYNMVDGINKLERKMSEHRLTVREDGLLSIGSAKPKNFLVPNRFYRVRILPLIVESMSIDDCVKYQKTKPNNIFIGGQGILILSTMESYRKHFPEHHRMFSLDEEENLFQSYSQSPHMVTYVYRASFSNFEIGSMAYNNILFQGDCVAFFTGPFER